VDLEKEIGSLIQVGNANIGEGWRPKNPALWRCPSKSVFKFPVGGEGVVFGGGI
jgi:hypothetical protein